MRVCECMCECLSLREGGGVNDLVLRGVCVSEGSICFDDIEMPSHQVH